jgi:hypothetical protein
VNPPERRGRGERPKPADGNRRADAETALEGRKVPERTKAALDDPVGLRVNDAEYVGQRRAVIGSIVCAFETEQLARLARLDEGSDREKYEFEMV